MRTRNVLALAAGVLSVSVLSSWRPRTAAPPPPPEPAHPYEIPQEPAGPAFEPNRGQAPADVLFVSQSPAPNVALTRRGARFRLPAARGEQPIALELELVGARPTVRLEGDESQRGRSHYYLGNDPAAWVTDVPHFGRVRYQDVYAGVDASFHGHEDGLEYDFTVRPGADPAAIRLRFANATDVTLDGNGDLLLETKAGTARQRAPFAFQEESGRRLLVPARYRVDGRRDVALELGTYDRTRPLVIDPVLVFGTYLEGSNTSLGDMAADAEGNSYVAGSVDPSFSFRPDTLIFKLSPDGQIVYRTQLGGFRGDTAHAIAIDAAGNAWVTGYTLDPGFSVGEFPRTVGAYQTTPGGGGDAYFLKLDRYGTLQYSSLLGSTGDEAGEGIAIGPGGDVYVGGTTTSPTFPLQNPLQPAIAGARDAFVSRFDPTGVTLRYSTYLGGSGEELLAAVRVDAAGRMFAAGTTNSPDFPSSSPVQGGYGGGGHDGYVARLDAAGTMLELSTYLGGSGDDWVNGLAVDASSAALVTGRTISGDFPLERPLKASPTASDRFEGFLSKLSPAGLAFSSYVGRNGGGDVAVAPSGAVFMTGALFDINDPGGMTASKLDAGLTAYQWTFGDDGGHEIAVHADGSVIAGGNAGGISDTFPMYRAVRTQASSCADCTFTMSIARIADAPQPNAQFEQDAPTVAYAGSWTTLADPAASGGSLAYTAEQDASVEIAFTGTGIQLFGRRAPSGGSAEWTVNSGFPKGIAFHSDPPQPRALLLSITGLLNGAHRIALRNTGGDVWFDGFTVLTDGPRPTLTPVPGTPTGAPTVRSTPTATPIPPASWTRIESNDARIVYTGHWHTHASGNHSAGSARLSDGGSGAALTFTGNAVRWIGVREPAGGIANIYLDGAFLQEVDTYSATEQTQAVMGTWHFPQGTHTLEVRVSGLRRAGSQGGWVWVDAFDVAPSSAPTATPSPRPTGTVGPTPTPTPTATGAPTPGPTTRVENSDPRVAYAGTWFVNTSPNANHSGGSSHLAGDAGSTATLTFEGTGVKWQGLKDPWAGIARVSIDGALRATVDTYSAVEQLRQTLFTIDGLAAGSHVIRIEVTGTQNPSSGGSLVWVDAFDVTTGGGIPTMTPTPRPTGTVGPTATPAATATPTPRSTPRVTPTPTPTGAPTPGVTRVEDGDPRITYAGTWYTNTSPAAQHSGGSARLTGEAGATATLAFNGTGVRWLGLKDPWAGIARVYVDGTLRATVDTYSAVEQLRQVLFSIDGLPAGPHTIRIEVTGGRHPSSGGDLVWVDAFDVTSE